MKPRARVQDIVQLLSVVTEGAAPAAGFLTAELRTLLHAGPTVLYNYRREDDHLEIDQAVGAGADIAGFRRQWNAGLRATPAPWLMYNPALPEPGQRNRVLTAQQLSRLVSAHRVQSSRPLFSRVGAGGMDQLRVLVCDGPALLAWVGCFREEPFTRADSGLLRELVPAIQNRLRIENYLQTQPLYLSALRAALDAIPGEAFVVSTAGGRLSVIEANLIGRAALDGVRRATLDDLRRSLAGTAAAPYLVKELASPGIPHHSLAVRHTPRLGDQTALRLRLAQTRWELSPKQAAVLRHLAAGDANKTIATKLVLAEVTVEKHVTAVLMKAAVDSRAALIAAFWSQRLDG